MIKAGMADNSISHWFLAEEGDVGAASRKNDCTGGDKPPYRVPVMEEVRAVPWNGLTVASTFAGCGGSSTGYRMAGFRILWANEFDAHSRECYAANMREGTVLDGRDIRAVEPGEVLSACSLAEGELDVLDGSPPCQTFSTAGRRRMDDPRSDLFMEYARLLRGLRPRAFIAENVSGMVKGVAKGQFKAVMRELKAAGYRVSCRLLDAQWLGVPQRRQRVIFVGVREDLGADPCHPSPLPYRYSVRDACPWIGRVVQDTKGQHKTTDQDGGRPNDAITASNAYHLSVMVKIGDEGHTQKRGNTFPKGVLKSICEPAPSVTAAGMHSGPMPELVVSGADECSIEGTAIGREAEGLAVGGQSGRYFNLQNVDPSAPSPAILAAHGGRPTASPVIARERRKFTITELRRICSFPDDFVLTGSYAKQWARLGNSVPPLMMCAIAETVRDRVLSRG